MSQGEEICYRKHTIHKIIKNNKNINLEKISKEEQKKLI